MELTLPTVAIAIPMALVTLGFVGLRRLGGAEGDHGRPYLGQHR